MIKCRKDKNSRKLAIKHKKNAQDKRKKKKNFFFLKECGGLCEKAMDLYL